jgi:hypothetical protein
MSGSRSVGLLHTLRPQEAEASFVFHRRTKVPRTRRRQSPQLTSLLDPDADIRLLRNEGGKVEASIVRLRGPEKMTAVEESAAFLSRSHS